MVSCKNEAVRYLGFESSYSTIKEKASVPLKSELKLLLKIEKTL